MTTTGHSQTAAAYWDALYGGADQLFSGNPNSALVREVAGLAPGTALELGCGEGADAVWLARHGWRVTGVDVSRVALDRAAAHAAAAGVTDRTAWETHDLATSFPTGTYDLVSAQFLQSLLEFPRERVLRSAAGAVAPGGTLLVVGHGGQPPPDPDTGPDLRVQPALPTPQEVLDGLDLAAGDWEVRTRVEDRREVTGADGEVHRHLDSVLRVRRVERTL